MHPQSVSTSDKRALRILNAAAIYGLSRSTLYKLMSNGKLRTVKVGGRRLIPKDAIEALFATAA